MSDYIRFEAPYLGYELYNGQYLLLVELPEQEFAGVIIPGSIGEVSVENITSITFSESREGQLNTYELSPRRKRVAEMASNVENKSGILCVVSLLGLTAAGVTGIFFPPALAAVPPLAKTALGSIAMGVASEWVSECSRTVNYATITCEASVSTNRVDTSCTVPIRFTGNMQSTDLLNLYAQWKNRPTPPPGDSPTEVGTALACLPTSADFHGTTTVVWEQV